MKAHCHQCGTNTDCEAFSGLCVDCLIERSKQNRPAKKQVAARSEPPDYKKAQAGDPAHADGE